MTDSGDYCDDPPGDFAMAESHATLTAIMARAGNPSPVSGTTLAKPVAKGDYGDMPVNEKGWPGQGSAPWVPGR